MLAKLAAQGCNVLFKELGLRRRMNFYFEFKSSSEWKHLAYLKSMWIPKKKKKES
jgi:hypothetical protein